MFSWQQEEVAYLVGKWQPYDLMEARQWHLHQRREKSQDAKSQDQVCGLRSWVIVWTDCWRPATSRSWRKLLAHLSLISSSCQLKSPARNTCSGMGTMTSSSVPKSSRNIVGVVLFYQTWAIYVQKPEICGVPGDCNVQHFKGFEGLSSICDCLEVFFERQTPPPFLFFLGHWYRS